MSSVLKSLAMSVPAYRNHMKRVQELTAHLEKVAEERDRLAVEVRDLREALRVSGPAADVDPKAGWAEAKRRKQELSAEIRAQSATSRLSLPIEPVNFDMDES